MTDVVAGRFALCDPMARGGTGVVWRAYDRKLDQFCAAKVLRRRDAGDLLRSVHEQSVRLAHRHLLTPYSWAADDVYVVLASELVDGGSVGALLTRHGPLSEATVTTILDQLLQALEHVHAAGLVHRDVTPANLLLRATRTGPVQTLLADFGLATGDHVPRVPRLDESSLVVGTPGYLPPEVFDGAAPHPRHDLYAAGQVAAALVTGIEPTEVARDGKTADPEPPLLPPGRLSDTIAALTANDRSHRLDSARSARALLAAPRASRAPRTREGLVVMVTAVLRPLTENELADARDDASGDALAVARAGITPVGTPVHEPAAPASAPVTVDSAATEDVSTVTSDIGSPALPSAAAPGAPRRRTRPTATKHATEWRIERRANRPGPTPGRAPLPERSKIATPVTERSAEQAVEKTPPVATRAATVPPDAADKPAPRELPGLNTMLHRPPRIDVAEPTAADEDAAQRERRIFEPNLPPTPDTSRLRTTVLRMNRPPRPTDRHPTPPDSPKAVADPDGRQRSKLPIVRPSRRTTTTVLGAVAASAVVISTVLALSARSTAPAHRGQPKPVIPSTPPVGANGQVVQAGVACTWQEQGNLVTITTGRTLQCTGSTDGFHWTTVD